MATKIVTTCDKCGRQGAVRLTAHISNHDSGNAGGDDGERTVDLCRDCMGQACRLLLDAVPGDRRRRVFEALMSPTAAEPAAAPARPGPDGAQADVRGA